MERIDWFLEEQIVEIPLSQGKVAIIDVENAPEVLRFKWCAHKKRHLWYAVTSVRKEDGTRTVLSLHRLILKPSSNVLVDHRDGDGLNNRKSNLRLATNAQNQHNSRRSLHNTSGFKGVDFNKRRCQWRALICFNNKRKHLGRFQTKEEAAAAYDTAARKFFGEYARPNEHL